MSMRGVPKETVGPRAEETWQEGILTRATWIVLIVLTIGNLSCVALFFLTGFGLTELSDVALASLAGATVGQTAGLVATVFKTIASI